MNKHQGFIALFWALLLSPGVRAQDERVHPYMRAVSDQFSIQKSYYLEVDYIREDIMRETRVEGEGLIWMKGYQYKMTMDEYIVSFDGEKQYSHNTDMQEVYVSVPDPHNAGYLQAVPMSVIKSYEKDFKFQFMGERPFMGKQRIEIQLYPRDLNGPYSMLKVFVHPVSMKLDGFVLKHKEGINYTMVIRQIEETEQLKDSSFRFNQADWPDTEIIELIE